MTDLIPVAVILVLAAAVATLIKQNNKLKIQCDTDTQTGVDNLSSFSKKYQNWIRKETDGKYFVAYLRADIESMQYYMKPEQMEEKILHAAEKIKGSCVKGDFVARVCEASFAAIYHCKDVDAAKWRVLGLLGMVNAETAGTGLEFRAGICAAEDIPADQILYRARGACVTAEKKNTPVYIMNDHKIKLMNRRSSLQSSLGKALEQDEFEVYIQFVVDAKKNQIIGGEVVSRWISPRDGVRMPGIYIDALEKADLIHLLDYSMLDKTCMLLEQWKDTDKKDLYLSCNFARGTISRKDFLETFRNITGKYQFDYRKLIIEITEDMAPKDLKTARSNATALKELGIRLALDDLGTGVTTFRDFYEYPVDIIKLDKGLLTWAGTGDGLKLLKGIADLAHSMGKKVIAEGVAEESDLDLARGISSDYLQGFYYTEPLPKEEARRYLEETELFHPAEVS